MECTLYKGQYTGKAEKAFNIRLNHHCKDIYKANTLEADQNFRLPCHNLNRHENFTQREQLNNTKLDKELLTFRLKKREDFWIHKCKTLKSQGFNTELNLSNP